MKAVPFSYYIDERASLMFLLTSRKCCSLPSANSFYITGINSLKKMQRQIRDTVWIRLMEHGPHRHQQNWKWAPAIFAFTPKASWKVEQLLGHHSVSHREGDVSTLSEVDVFLCPSGGWQSLRSHLVGRDSDGLFAQTHQCIEPFIRYVGTALRACTILLPQLPQTTPTLV